MRPHALQLRSVHETVFEDGFDDVRFPGRLRHQRHELGLHVGRKAGVFPCRDIDGAQLGAAAHDQRGIVGGGNFAAGLLHLFQHGLQMRAIRAFQAQFIPDERPGNQKGAGFDPVGNDAVLGAAEAVDALHANGPRFRRLRSSRPF